MDLEDALTEVAEYYNPAEHEAARTIANEVWRLREELAAKTAAFEQLSNSIHLRSAREPLVQEVIAATKAVRAAAIEWDLGELEVRGHRLREANRKLADWTP